MDRVRHNAWWGPFGLGLIVAMLGIGDVVGGLEFDAASAEAVGGQGVDQLRQAGAAWRVLDHGTRHGGIDLVVLGTLFAVLAAIPLRGGAWWAWWTLWLLPTWLLAGFVFTLAYGLAPGAALPGSTMSGPVLAIVAAVFLLLARPRSDRVATRAV